MNTFPPRQTTNAMTLRFPFPKLQLLSAAFAALAIFAAPRAAFSQAPAVGADYVILKPASTPSQPVQLVGVLITGVRGTKMTVRNTQGEIAYDLSQIQEVRKAAPADFVQGQRLIETGDLAGALPLIKSVADKFRGLPTTWASDASSTLGNLLISLGKLSEAETAFDDFQKAYPGAGSSAASIGKARLAVERGRFAEARAAVEPVVADALQRKNVTRAENQLFGQAYYILGKAAEGEGKLPEAMENYCRTVAIFYQERAVVKEAQNRIDDLRKKGITTP